MKVLRNFFYLIFTILLLFPSGIPAQNPKPDDPDDVLIKAAREIMTEASTCALITLDEEGRPRVRMMDPFKPENDFIVWLGTNPESRKVDQIKQDPRVTLYYEGRDDSGYVMIHGQAQLVSDKKEKEKWWKPEWSAFYSDRQQGFLLIKVSPQWMEVVSYKYGLVGDSISWEPPGKIFKTEN
jgi:general stress protein 26